MEHKMIVCMDGLTKTDFTHLENRISKLKDVGPVNFNYKAVSRDRFASFSVKVDQDIDIDKTYIGCALAMLDASSLSKRVSVKIYETRNGALHSVAFWNR